MSSPSGAVVADLDEAEAAEISDEERVARHLRQNILEQITGEASERVKRDFPSDRFFAGALSPQSEDQLDDRDDDLQSKMQPSAIGATVKLDGDGSDDELVIGIRASVWIRVNPTFDEVQNRESFVALGDVEDGEEDESELLPVFDRIPLSVPDIRVSYGELADAQGSPVSALTDRARDALTTAFDTAREQAASREDVFVDPGEDQEDGIPQSALEDEETYREYLESREGEPAIPNWQARLELTSMIDRESDSDELIVDIELANVAQRSRRDVIHNLRDPTLFEVSLDLRTEGELEFVPYTFDPLPQDFRYNRDLWGHGRNCTVVEPDYRQGLDGERTPGRSPPEEDPTASKLETRFLPQFRQLVYETADRGVEARFEELADLEDGGFELLDDISSAMRAYHRDAYDDALEEYRTRDDWNRDGHDEEDFAADRAAFEREITRFERGVGCLRDQPDTVGRAFELMNETMDRMHEFDSWHLFQLVFIVMLVPDIASREYEEYADVEWRSSDTGDRVERADSALDVVDVLWFPTGGGKTEAFLGISVWNMFFDRIRGKSFGVTTWTKFPLRLLSLQQLQRMTETMMYADLVRREQPDIDDRPSRPFSVGFLVGKRNTPNALTGYNNDNAERYRNNESLREDAKVIPICPACDSKVKMRVTEDLRLAHYCTGTEFDCDWQQRSLGGEETYDADELPVHVVDNELYRYAPSILAGTIDKITAIGYQRKMAHLITGRMEYECPIHGFASLGECTEKYGCSIDRDEFVDLASPLENEADDLAPSLVVPDELHLLEESVGSFDGHYETGVDTLQQLVDAGRTKVLAPTATITAFEDQVYHLFLRPAERFPAPGPYLRENFYAVERPETQRYYVGIIPHGKTHINAIIDLLYYFHFEIQTLIRKALQDPEALLDGSALVGTDTDAQLSADSIDEVLPSLLRYSTSLTYLLSRKEGDRLDQSIVSQLENYLGKDDRPGLNHERMTGGTPFEKVQEILDRLQEPWQEEHDREVLGQLVEDEVVREEVTDQILELRQGIEELLDEEVSSPVLTTDELHERLAESDGEVTEGLAWLLASRPNTVTATSMISHGIDVARFNFMLFFGMPRQTAEYIQSSSRAGRQYPGLIFNVFHPIRERDLSHYHFFEKYHEFLDRLVEPVAINRWAKNSGRRTHPGLFMGLLLNHYMYQDGADKLFFGERAKDLFQTLTEEDVEEIVAQMYGGEELAPEEFIHQARADTERAIQQIQQDDSKWTSDRVPESPMRSLRDVDEQLPIRYLYDYRDVFETLDSR